MFIEIETSSDSSENSNFAKDNTNFHTNIVDKKIQQILDDEEDLSLQKNMLFPKEDMKSRISSAQERMNIIIKSFDEYQMRRYEIFRRISISKPLIKRFIQKITDHTSVNPNLIIIISGVSKVFAGELIEMALELQHESCEKENSSNVKPLKPQHLIEAKRRLLNLQYFIQNKDLLV